MVVCECEGVETQLSAVLEKIIFPWNLLIDTTFFGYSWCKFGQHFLLNYTEWVLGSE